MLAYVTIEVPQNVDRSLDVREVRTGGSVIEVASKVGVTRATLYRWLKAFDPERPLASLRSQKPGPKAPHWEGGAE